MLFKPVIFDKKVDLDKKVYWFYITLCSKQRPYTSVRPSVESCSKRNIDEYIYKYNIWNIYEEVISGPINFPGFYYMAVK